MITEPEAMTVMYCAMKLVLLIVGLTILFVVVACCQHSSRMSCEEEEDEQIRTWRDREPRDLV